MKGTAKPMLPSVEDYMQDNPAHILNNLLQNSTYQTLCYNLI